MEDTAERRARLKAIREAANASGEAEQPEGGHVGGNKARDDYPNSQEPALKFRNYAIRDEKIGHEKACLHVPVSVSVNSIPANCQ